MVLSELLMKNLEFTAHAQMKEIANKIAKNIILMLAFKSTKDTRLYIMMIC